MSPFVRDKKLTAPGILIIALCLISLTSFGQTARRRPVKEDTHKALLAFGLTTNTNSGIIGGAVVRYTSQLSGTFMGRNQYQYLALEVANVKSPKEFSSASSGFNTTWNKMNYLFAVRPQYGREVFFFNRQENEGIGLSGLVAVGPTLGIEKPYMINLQEGGRTITIPYDPNRSGGYTSAGFLSGFGKSKIVPGLHAKAAVNIELNTFRNNVTGIEVGFLAEAYTRTIKLMGFPTAAAVSDHAVGNKNFFTSGYVTLYFGSKR